MKRFKAICFAFIGLMLFSSSIYAHEYDPAIELENPPSGFYVAVSSTHIENTSGDRVSIKKILDDKRKSVAEEVYQSLAKRDGTGILISADLEGTSENPNTFLWGSNGSFGSNEESDSFVIRNGTKAGGVPYNIFVPVGCIKHRDEDGDIIEVERINEEYISATNNLLSEFKRAVKEGILAGSIKAGFNIYEPYSESQLYIDKVTKKEENLYVFNNTGDINYVLDYFYSPIFGKMYNGEVPLITKDWEPYINKVGNYMKTIKSDKTVKVQVDDGYMDFLQGNAPECDSIKETDSNDLVKAKGVEPYKMVNAQYKPSSAVNYMLRVAIPTKISKIKPGVYGVDEASYKVVENIKLSIANNYVYITNGMVQEDEERQEEEDSTNKDVGEEGAEPQTRDNDNNEEADEENEEKEENKDKSELVKDGSFNDYNIDRGRLALYNVKQANGKINGVLIPLKYLEAVYDTSDSSNGELMATGRFLEFVENYSKNLKFILPSTGMFNLVVPNGGSNGAVVRNYAFEDNASSGSGIMEVYKDKKNHKQLDDEPNSVLLQIVFSNNRDKGRGFLMVRNNTYIQDSSLIAWLKSSNAESNTWVDADELLKKITGVYENTSEYLSYDEWLRMQEISEELEMRNKNFLVRVTNVVCIVFGVVIACYSWLLILAYYLDVFNTFFDDISIMQFMTLGRYYPVATKEEKEFLQQSSSADVKYVYIHNVLLMTLIGCIIGLVFINASVVVKFVVNVYLYIKYMLGGV